MFAIVTLSHDTHWTGGASRPWDGFLTQLGSGDWDQPTAAAAVSTQAMKLGLKLLLNNTDLQAMAAQRWTCDRMEGNSARQRRRG